MIKELTIKELLTNDITYETKQYYSQIINSPKINERRGLKIEIEDEDVDKDELILNPIIIIELDELSDLEFDTLNIFENISCTIGGVQIEKINYNQLKIYQSVEKNKIKKDGLKIFYPINFCSFNENEGFINCKWYDKTVCIEFTSNPCISSIKKLYLRTDSLIAKTKFNYSNVNKYCMDYSSKYDIYRYENIINKNDDDCLLMKVKQTQYFGIYNIYPNLINQNIRIPFNHLVEKFFIYFENKKDNSIYKQKPFDKIEFISNGNHIIQFDYETLVVNNNEKIIGYKLPRGVYQIDWKKYFSTNLSCIDNLSIKLYGISTLNDVGFCIIANNINYLKYHQNNNWVSVLLYAS